MEAARELTKMRLLAQTVEHRRDLEQSYGECLLLDKYGRLPSMADLRRDSKRKVTLTPKDDNNALIRVIVSPMFPFRVYRTALTADIYVFIKTERHNMPSSYVVGWLPSYLVLAMPTEKIPDRPNDFFHVVESGFLISMPNTFVFTEPEHHLKNQWNGIWNDLDMGYECCTCGRIIPDQRMYDMVMRERATAADVG